MAGVAWHYVLKFIITGTYAFLFPIHVRQLGRDPLLPWCSSRRIGDAAVGKSSLLIRLTDQRFLANPDPTVRIPFQN